MPDMLIFIFISALAIVLFGAGFYFWRSRAPQHSDGLALPPPPDFSGLFHKPISARRGKLAPAGDPEAIEGRQALLARAAKADYSALESARANPDPGVYDEVLNSMVDSAGSEPALMELVTYVMGRDNLRVNAKLARRMQEPWKANPTRGGTSRMLHITARANDAKLLEEAIELALQFWRQQRIPEMSAVELLSLFNGEFWTLSAEQRRSGAGFVLKRTLAKCQRELEGTADQ